MVMSQRSKCDESPHLPEQEVEEQKKFMEISRIIN